MVERKVRVCDRCDKNISKGVCETCGKDICETCFTTAEIMVEVQCITYLKVCKVCLETIDELEFPKDPDLKKELLEKIKNLMVLENLKDKPKKPAAVAWPVPKKKTNLWSKRMIGKGWVKTSRGISTGHPMSNTGTFKLK